MHQVPHLITLFSEEHGELKQRGGHSHYKHRMTIHRAKEVTANKYFLNCRTYSNFKLKSWITQITPEN